MLNWCCTSFETAVDIGVTLPQFVCLAKCNGLHPLAVYGSDVASLNLLRDEVKRVTSSDDVVFIVSYSRKTSGQLGDGHFSPIAGYHEGRDLVLMLDIARFKYPPYWMKLETMLESMKPLDSVTGKSRGFVVLSVEKEKVQSPYFEPSSGMYEIMNLKRGRTSPELLDINRNIKVSKSNGYDEKSTVMNGSTGEFREPCCISVAKNFD
ncbi:glutathione gamma-glutamylcysteinyltransferase [Elysia marginata]|uniref:glutathione gamma-glutamylcysteinyltransferase n=1 Tax=Elysia marginata TaxID=1093978 RepID=A0AAV4HRY0_9GAST|nr:glutathione gamma-glutamylcysteinyltransferase [Elysia marginata]